MKPEQLEAKVKAIQAKEFSLEELPDDELFALVAWEMWKDGMDWDQGVSNMAEGKVLGMNTRENCIHALKVMFGY
jgi:hypothetical protein